MRASGRKPKVAIGAKEVDEIIRRLDDELARSRTYVNNRRSAIDSLKQIVSSRDIDASQRLECLLRLGDSYNVLNTDSALTFYFKGYNLANSLGLDSVSARFKLRSATYLPLLAFITQAKESFDSINPATLPPGLMEEYYDAARRCILISRPTMSITPRFTIHT